MLDSATTITVNALGAATAWLNAFLATGGDDNKPVLNRTLAVEFFPEGIQFIACDGTILFRTWVAKKDSEADWPEDWMPPTESVVVMDTDHFALAFVRTLLAASKEFEVAELSLTVEDAPEAQSEDLPLGSEFSAKVLTLRAFGQQLHCRLYDGEYVGWRNLDFGLDKAERVDGMYLSPRMFATVGKLKSIFGVELTFTGGESRILVTGDDSVRGILMPMRRRKKERVDEDGVVDE